MSVFAVCPSDDYSLPCAWIEAGSTAEARRLVSLNVATHAEATDESLFDCYEDDTHSPPTGVILAGGKTYTVRIR